MAGGISLVTMRFWFRLTISRVMVREVSVRSSPLTANQKAMASRSERSFRSLLRFKVPNQFVNPVSSVMGRGFQEVPEGLTQLQQGKIASQFSPVGQGDLSGGLGDNQGQGVALLGDPHRGAMAGAQGGVQVGVAGQGQQIGRASC